MKLLSMTERNFEMAPLLGLPFVDLQTHHQGMMRAIERY